MNLIEHACLLRDRVRERAPLVHCMTNFVAMDTAANAVLAIGASPAMMHAREEVAEFAAIADALTINIGTLSPDWVGSMKVAAEAATKAGKPWVFDPVGVGATGLRRRSAAELLALRGRIKSDTPHPRAAKRPASDIEILRDISDRLNSMTSEIEATLETAVGAA